MTYIKVLEENNFTIDWRYSDTKTIKDLEAEYTNKDKENSKFNDYPEDDVEILYEAVVEQYSLSYGIDLSTRSKDEVLKNYIYPTIKQYMIVYYIYDEQELELLDSTIESQKSTNAVISECYAVYDTVMNYLLDNAKVK